MTGREGTGRDAEGTGAVHYASFVETCTDLADSSFWARASRERSIEGWRRMLQDGLEATIAEIEGSTVTDDGSTFGGIAAQRMVR